MKEGHGKENLFFDSEHQSFQYEILSDPEGRKDLLMRMDSFIQKVKERDIHSVVFLDRSARPLAWLFRERFSFLHADESIPDIKFVNIGSTHLGREEETHKKLSKSPLVSLQKKQEWFYLLQASIKDQNWLSDLNVPEIFLEETQYYTHEIEELKKRFKKSFDAKNVVIVDEIIATGMGLAIALALFRTAFPNAQQFSVQAFYMDQGEPNDFRSIPWFHRKGMTGVLELPDPTLFSGNISMKNVLEIEQYPAKKYEKIINDFGIEIQEHKEEFQSTVLLLMNAAQKLFDTNPSMLLACLEELKSTQTQLVYSRPSEWLAFYLDACQKFIDFLDADQRSLTKENKETFYKQFSRFADSSLQIATRSRDGETLSLLKKYFAPMVKKHFLFPTTKPELLLSETELNQRILFDERQFQKLRKEIKELAQERT